MREATFNGEIIHSIEKHGWFGFKIPDMPRSAFTRFVPTKPFDISACIHGKFVGIESKQFKAFQGIGINDFRPNQVIALDEIVKNKGVAFAFINVRIKADKEAGTKRINVGLAIPWDFFGEKFSGGFRIHIDTVRELVQKKDGWHNNVFVFRSKKRIFNLSFLEARCVDW